ncbi:MAG: hypothetical protein C0608_06875 [Deltaproteobacteria bacterium]|nr:MAG: hypothetical protein C0608_06875 [Deltaproteobacteria bacterium]
MESAFSTQGLTVYLQGRNDLRKILSEVSIKVNSGRTFALLGESGSGKTCLIQSVLGIHPGLPGVVEGSARILGKEVFGELKHFVEASYEPTTVIKKNIPGWKGAMKRAWGDSLGREVALIPQDATTALSPFHTIGQMLQVALRRGNPDIEREEAVKQSLEWLRKVEMYDVDKISELYIHELSGGMAQRVAIALALAPGPKLLIADEPTTGLDATLKLSIISLLSSIVKEEGATLLLVTHDLSATRMLAYDVAVLYAGNIVESGDVSAVLDKGYKPKHPYTWFLLESEARLLAGDSPRLGRKDNIVSAGCSYAVHCPKATSRCLLEQPELVEIAEGHRIACFEVRR